MAEVQNSTSPSERNETFHSEECLEVRRPGLILPDFIDVFFKFENYPESRQDISQIKKIAGMYPFHQSVELAGGVEVIVTGNLARKELHFDVNYLKWHKLVQKFQDKDECFQGTSIKALKFNEKIAVDTANGKVKSVLQHLTISSGDFNTGKHTVLSKDRLRGLRANLRTDLAGLLPDIINQLDSR